MFVLISRLCDFLQPTRVPRLRLSRACNTQSIVSKSSASAEVLTLTPFWLLKSVLRQLMEMETCGREDETWSGAFACVCVRVCACVCVRVCEARRKARVCALIPRTVHRHPGPSGQVATLQRIQGEPRSVGQVLWWNQKKI